MSVTPKFKSKKDVVYEVIKENIIQGVYEPGSRLVIDELVTQLHVSQIPIREAIKQLEADGFVNYETHVGARVADVDARFVTEVFSLLESMEIICSRVACQTMNDDQLSTLTNMVTEMDAMVNDPLVWSERNRALHLFICECADTQLILKMMRKIFDHWARLRRVYLQDVANERVSDAQTEHKLLLEALKRRDPDEVERIIRYHNRGALSTYVHYLESAGFLDATGS